MGWKTISGGILGIGAWLFAQPAIGLETLFQAGGMLLAVIGVRHGIAKGPKK